MTDTGPAQKIEQIIQHKRAARQREWARIVAEHPGIAECMKAAADVFGKPARVIWTENGKTRRLK